MYDDLTCLAVFLNLQNHMYAGVGSIKDVLQLFELLFDMTTNCWRYFHVTPGVFKRHSVLALLALCQASAVRRLCALTLNGLVPLDHCAAFTRPRDVHLVTILCHCPAR